MSKAEDNRFPYVTVVPGSAEPDLAPDDGDQRLYFDDTEDVVLLKTVDTDDVEQPHWPIYVIPNGGTPPAGLAPHTIILEEAP